MPRDRQEDHLPTKPLRDQRGGGMGQTEDLAQAGGGPGSRLARFRAGVTLGHYVIERGLGSGGMGEVYAALDLDSGHRVALKFPAQVGRWAPDMQRRFIREGLLAASVNHPNSLYVYGTEEIDGVPVIAMELAPGGTLQDRIDADGPMLPGDAVHAVLQVVDGLRAAAEAGVIHRDVKPSNCFVGRGGLVKIGDFGLSVPSGREGESRLTHTGGILGTLGFSSPEQLRGGDLDIRSDIYAVGATLYYLLTGHAPFEGVSAMQVLAAVLEKTPRSPSRLQPGIPDELAQTVLQCLAKNPADRPHDYVELRRRLEPYGGLVPQPSARGVRSAAGALDWLMFNIVLGAAADGPGSSGIAALTMFLVTMAVYSTPEVWWGRSPGKMLLGLRTVNVVGRRLSRRRSYVRSGLWAAPPTVAYACMSLLPDSAQLMGAVAGVVYMLSPLCVFARSRTAHAPQGWHDRVAGSMVAAVLRQEPASSPHAERSPQMGRNWDHFVGPFAVSRDPKSVEPGGVLEGQDRTLNRQVWIQIRTADSPETPETRRGLCSRGRPRWLNGGRSSTFAWDAYEAPGGLSLAQAISAGVSWQGVRRWLLDLAVELDPVRTHEAALPPLSLDRVWIASDGQAVLLDFPVPKSSGYQPPAGPHTESAEDLVDSPRALLKALTDATVGGNLSEARGSRVPATPLPLHAHRLMRQLEGDDEINWRDLLVQLQKDGKQPASLSRQQRALQMSGFGIPVGLVMIQIGLMFGLEGDLYSHQRLETARAIEREHPGWIKTEYCLSQLYRLDRLPASAERRQRQAFLEIHLIHGLADITQDTTATCVLRVLDPNAAAAAGGGVSAGFVDQREPIFDRRSRARIRLARERWATVEPHQVISAREHLNRELSDLGFRLRRLGDVVRTYLISLHLVIAWLAPLAFLAGIFFEGGPLIRASGLTVVTTNGREAGRARLALRSAATWALPALAQLVVSLGYQNHWFAPGSPIFQWGHALPMLLFAVGAAEALRCPSRGIQDRVAGTWLVPR